MENIFSFFWIGMLAFICGHACCYFHNLGKNTKKFNELYEKYLETDKQLQEEQALKHKLHKELVAVNEAIDKANETLNEMCNGGGGECCLTKSR